MKLKTFMAFAAAVAIFSVAAVYDFGDSGHSIGLITRDGGKVRHPVHFAAGTDRRMLIATATVIPPYRGDARVVLEGEPAMEHHISFSRPIVDLGFKSWPRFENDTLYDLEPRDRIALWVEMHPPEVDPVCGMAAEDGYQSLPYGGKTYHFCSDACRDRFKREPERFRDRDVVYGTYHLAFYDTKTEQQVLRVPIIFEGKEDAAHAGGHHH